MRPLIITLITREEAVRGDGGADLTKVQSKATQNCHNHTTNPPCTMNIYAK
jgi:hypothetical protein